MGTIDQLAGRPAGLRPGKPVAAQPTSTPMDSYRPCEPAWPGGKALAANNNNNEELY